MGHGAEQPAVADSASFGGLDQMSISVQLFKQSENYNLTKYKVIFHSCKFIPMRNMRTWELFFFFDVEKKERVWADVYVCVQYNIQMDTVF